MKHFIRISSIVAMTTISLVSGVHAQIRTPIATEPLSTTQAGPAPYNAKAVATTPTSASVSWDAMSGVRAYTVVRTRTDDAACCVSQSSLLTTPSWTDAALEAGKEYSFVISALYSDGRTGATEVVAATPMPELPSVRLPRGAELSSAEGVLRLTPCAQKSSGGPGPASISSTIGTPAGARFSWTSVPGSGVNYVVDRAPLGTTSWTLVGSTCGGPSPLYVRDYTVEVRDLAGGVSPNGRYVYRITAIASNGAAGWNTYHFDVPCRYAPNMQASVSGSTVSLTWDDGGNCGAGMSSLPPDTYTLSSSFGFTKTKSNYSWNKETIYGVPAGTHTFTMVGNYRTGGSTRTPPSSINVVVAY